jgi:membrane-associated phospholipid phosphatase
MLNSDSWKPAQSFLNFFKQLLVAHWQSLLLLLIGVCLPLLVVETLAADVGKYEGGFPWDVTILLAVHATAQPALTIAVTAFTELGVIWGVLPASIVLGLLLLKSRRWRSLAYWMIALLGSAVINRTAKEFMHRIRPQLWDYPPISEYSFPSGHAMSSMAFAVALIILMWNTRWRWWVVLSGSLFVVAIGWTRVYLGVHYPSDVLAGWMISLAWAIGVSFVIKPNGMIAATDRPISVESATEQLIEETSVGELDNA